MRGGAADAGAAVVPGAAGTRGRAGRAGALRPVDDAGAGRRNGCNRAGRRPGDTGCPPRRAADAVRGRQRDLAAAQPAARAGAAGRSTLLECHDLSGLDHGARQAAIEAAAGQVHAGFDLAAGPLLRAVLFTAAGQPPQLLLAAHHLVIDAVSWRILLEDLDAAYGQAAAGQPPAPPAKTTSFRDWATALHARARDGSFDDQLPHWTAIARAAIPPLPLDGHGPNTIASAEAVTVSLTREETRALLHDVPAAYRTHVNDVLLAALGRTLADWAGQPAGAHRLRGPRPRDRPAPRHRPVPHHRLVHHHLPPRPAPAHRRRLGPGYSSRSRSSCAPSPAAASATAPCATSPPTAPTSPASPPSPSTTSATSTTP